jgi:hypothetical protein
MNRWWFGVALALWASIASLIVYTPTAYAADEKYTALSPTQIRGFAGGVFGKATICPSGQIIFTNNNGTYTGTCTDPDGLVRTWEITGVTKTASGYTATVAQKGFNGGGAPSGQITIDNPNNIELQNAAAGAGGGTGTDPDAKPDCDAGPSTFLVCDWLIKPALWVIDNVQSNIIIPFLQEKPLDKADKDVQPIYNIWASIRNVASVFFILVFFLVIFGTAIGWDNYTVKKILPRLIAGAILVPFSWYICVIVIDIGNVLGKGLVTLMTTFIPAPKIDFTSPLSKVFLGTALLGAGAGAVSFAFTTLSLGVIISIIIAILATLLTLVLRKIFIMLLVILSPFALLAWILPNTSKWFKEWWTNFFKLVMMYPIIMLIFEAGRLFASTAGATFGNSLENSFGPLFVLIGLFVPTFMIPWSFKFAGKGMQAGASAVGKVASGAEKRWGKDSAGMKERHERFQNRRASTADNANRSYLSRGLARKQAGAGGFLFSGGATGRAKLRAMGAKHESLKGTDKGIRDVEKDTVKQVAQLRKDGKEDEANYLRDSLNRTGRTQAVYEAAKDKAIEKSGDSLAYNKGYDEMKEGVGKLRAQANEAESKGNAEGAKALRARADEYENSFTTAGRINYRASGTKSSYIDSKNDIVGYNEAKKGLGTAADEADAKATEADANGDSAAAAEHRDTAARLRLAASPLGKMNYGSDVARDKGVDSKVAIAAHLKGQDAVEDSAKSAETRAAEAEGKAAAAHTRADAALAAEDNDAFITASREAKKEAAIAESARAEATQLRGSRTILGRATYGTEHGARQIAAEKATVAAHNVSHEEVEAEAAQKELEGDFKAAADLRANLTTSGRLTMQIQEAKQKLVGEQAQLAGIARANENSVPDTGRQLEAGATIAAEKILQQRAAERSMEKITVRGVQTGVNKEDGTPIIEDVEYRAGTAPLSPKTRNVLEQEVRQALETGDHDLAISRAQSLGRSKSGRQVLNRIASERMGGNDYQAVSAEYNDVWTQMIAGADSKKNPTLVKGRNSAYKGARPTEFSGWDPQAKGDYMDWAFAKDQGGNYIQDDSARLEAANNVRYALATERSRERLSDEDYQEMHRFLDDPRSGEFLSRVVTPDEVTNIQGFLQSGYERATSTEGGATHASDTED